MGKNKYQATEPYISKHYEYSPTPRKLKRAAVFLLAVLAVLLLVLIVAIVAGALGDLWHNEMTDDQALTKVDDYREGDMVDLDAYLTDRNFEATGEPGAYVYRRGNKIISVQNYGEYVNVGDGKGTSHQYGLDSRSEIYICRFSCANSDPDIEVFYDLNLSGEALAEIIR
ncbi:hypothetical protein J5500_04535, partial [Candidatus Saccharibacteria bacterium]|nr:hypothetical protein [Candidatus Saccharibacteria bacterium]